MKSTGTLRKKRLSLIDPDEDDIFFNSAKREVTACCGCGISPPGVSGPPGLDGRDGADGKPGLPGKDGPDAVEIQPHVTPQVKFDI